MDENAICEKIARQQENGMATGKWHEAKPVLLELL